MDTIGDKLRQRRVAKGIALEAVVRATKLTRTMIAAIEEDRFDDLPAPVYARGFLKIYAQFLEIDPIPVVEAYEAQMARQVHLDAAAEAAVPAPRLPDYLRETQSKPVSLTPAGAALLAATAAIAVAFIWSVSRTKAKQAPVAVRPAIEAPATATGPDAPDASPARSRALPPLPGDRSAPRR